jgi:hypothetical protein
MTEDQRVRRTYEHPTGSENRETEQRKNRVDASKTRCRNGF